MSGPTDLTARPIAAPPRHAHWLSADRLRAYPLIVLAVYVASAIYWVLAGDGMIDPRGKPYGYDFITFWGASHLALGGEAAAAYDMVRIAAAEQAAVPGLDSVYLWHYPPTFFLVILPLALLPYLAAYLLFVGATLALYAAVVRRIAPGPQALLLIAAYPGLFVNLFHGQNGFLTAAILGAALLSIDRRPLAGGGLFGLMAYKPQFAVLVPVALAASRNWRAFAAAAVVAIAFVALSTAVLGTDVLVTFLRNTSFVRTLMEDGFLPWHKMPTIFAALRMLGVGIAPAYAAQAVCAAVALIGVAVVWRAPGPLALRAAMLVVATMLSTPYMFDYDMVMMALPIAWLAMDGIARGWLRGEREVLVLAWLAPLVAPALADSTHLQTAPLVTAALFALILRRARTLPG